MRYIILDRDGVINRESHEYVKTPDEWHAIPGSLEAIAALNQHGFKVLVVTNQSGVARGYYSIDTLHRIHDKMKQELAQVGGKIEDIFFCPHHPDEDCACRKPKPGMLFQAKEKYQLDLSPIYFIGDSSVDVKAAETAGCKPFLVMTGRGRSVLQKHPELAHVQHAETLSDAVKSILAEESHDE